MNPEKTEDGELILSYECDPFTAQSEYLFSKRQYAQKTGRNQGQHDVIAYHVRMSFKPSEVTAEQALELGRELAMRWTRGKHQFIVAAHTNTKNPHAHIVFNSVNLNCDGKYQDFKRSAIALRRVSDQICLEHGLSIIERPGLSKGYNRHEYLGEDKATPVRDRLRDLMDAALPACKEYNSFLAALQEAGVEIKRGKQLAFRVPGAKKFVRQDTLGDDYSVDAILERISGKRVAAPRKKASAPVRAPTKPSLHIDIQEKIQQGYGVGYENWARVFNIKQSAKTLIYLQENGITSYDDLVEKSAAASADYHRLSERLKVIEKRLGEITALQKQIGTYVKTWEVYQQYKTSKYNQDFYDTHQTDIILCQAAKRHFDSLGLKKLPSMQSLKQEWATLAAERKKLYSGYRAAKEKWKELLIAKSNADRILNYDPLRQYRHEIGAR